MQFSYRLVGTIEVPDDCKLNDTGSGIILGDGRELKIWESLELFDPEQEEHEDISFDEANAMGIFYDGEMCEFDRAYDAADLAKIEAGEEVNHG